MMKKFFLLILAAVMLLSMGSCGRSATPEVMLPEPEVASLVFIQEPVKAEHEEPVSAELPVEAAHDEQLVEDEAVPDAPAPAPVVPETPADSIPAATPAPAPSHSHAWIEISETVHHDAVIEQRKVVDQEGTEGHYEGGSYSVVICRCGAEFSSADAFLSHQRSAGDIEQHGGYTTSVRSDQVWVEGTPEVFHYETETVREAWDEVVVTGYRCSSCGFVM